MIIEQKVGNYELAADPEAVVTDVMYRDSKESIWEIANSAQEEKIHAEYIYWISGDYFRFYSRIRLLCKYGL